MSLSTSTVGNDPDQPKTDVLGLNPETLGQRLSQWNQPAYRVRQILEWVYPQAVACFEEMTNLPAELRQRLSTEFHLYQADTVADECSTDGTRKLLLRWADGTTSECVMIPDGVRRTACISTQVGCPVQCTFCASGIDGLQRNLHAGQIIEQAMRVRRVCHPHRLTNVVFMGIGEPLHNYQATLAAVAAINAPWGMNIAARRITISTVGLPKQIERLAEENLQITLAISLHAPNDDLRSRIIPWAQSITIDSLVKAANVYFAATGREITLEYVVLGGLNDQPRHAHELAAVAKRMRSNVNLIPYNPISGLPHQRPPAAAVAAFQSVLRKNGVTTNIRRSRGLDINGACGQLRMRR